MGKTKYNKSNIQQALLAAVLFDNVHLHRDGAWAVRLWPLVALVARPVGPWVISGSSLGRSVASISTRHEKQRFQFRVNGISNDVLSSIYI